MQAERFAVVLASAWIGVLGCIGLIAAPAVFAALPAGVAGRVVGRMLAVEAHVSLAVAVVLFLVARQSARREAAAGRASIFSAEVLCALAVLFCSVAGHFALQPMMASARAGQNAPFSVVALHAASVSFFAAKGIALAVFAWRLSCASPEATSPRTAS